MSVAFGLEMAEREGEAIVGRLGIHSLPIDPIEIAKHHGIAVEPKPDAAEGVSGMLLRHGDTFGILYATHIASKGFQRFSIAHELGHYFLDGHIDHVLKDGPHSSNAGFSSPNPYEREADSFAAGLLMPGHLFRKELNQEAPGLATIEALADLCQTSLTATAIRYAKLTEDAVAVVVSTGKAINFCRLSDAMTSLAEITWPKKGDLVPYGTATADINADPARVALLDRAEAEIDILDWLGGQRSVQGTEQVMGLGSYGRTLTVLSVDDMCEEDEEESLTESWTPRLRR